MDTIASRLNSTETAACMEGLLAGGPGNLHFSGISIDTRSLSTGNLFFAIRGPNQDGHRFIPDALSKGASGVVAESGYLHPGEFPSDRVLIKVRDTHRALKDLAAAVRHRWHGTIVGITGSMGKTTTKEFIVQMLGDAYSVYRSAGNYNNLYGLPLALFGLKSDHALGVFEMGMSAPGEIAEMCRIAAPTTGIITNVAPVHLEFFDSIEGIARAKEELVEALPPDGTLIYNGDIPLVCDIAARFNGTKISFGLSDGADIRADRIEIAGPDETRFRLSYGGTRTAASVPLAGVHFVMNALPAIALASRCGFTPKLINENLRHLKQVSMRGGMLHFKEGFTVIDDSYNSNPQALENMIEVLSRLPSYERRFLVAGEMLELGETSESLHFECGIFAADTGIDGIIGIRGAAREIVRAALSKGMSEKQARFFPDTEEASGFLGETLQKGDLVLVKGSRGVHMEKIIQNLRSKFECISD